MSGPECVGINEAVVASEVRVVGVIWIARCGDVFVMEGTVPGTLLCILHPCVCLVKRRVSLLVGPGVAIIGGASVMRCIVGSGS